MQELKKYSLIFKGRGKFTLTKAVFNKFGNIEFLKKEIDITELQGINILSDFEIDKKFGNDF